MRRYGFAVVAAAMALFVALMPGAASASTVVLTYGSPGGAAVAVGDTFTAAGTITLYTSATGSTGIRCTISITFRVTSNPTAPGTATLEVTGVAITDCTSNLSGVSSVRSVVFDHLPYPASIGSSGTLTVTAGSAGPVQLTVMLNTLLGSVTCAYQRGAGLAGLMSNIDDSITISNNQFGLVVGPAMCPGILYLTIHAGPVAGPGGYVYVN